jgi:uncharacterized heparinase superfamily protein
MGRRDRYDMALVRAAEPALTWLDAILTAARHRIGGEWSSTRVYRLTLNSPGAAGFVAGPRDFRPADPDLGRQILAGRFLLSGATMEAGPGGDPWNRPSPSRLFAAQLHRFAWAPDLLSIGEAGSRELFRLFMAWREVFDQVSPFAWSPDILERRVFNLACATRRLGGVGSDAEVQILASSLAAQARQLLRLGMGPPRAAERSAAAAVAGAALGGQAGEAILRKALPRLSQALVVAVLPDGGLKIRSPEGGLELLLDLLTLDDVLLQRGREAPVEVARAIDRLSAALRFFTLGDGRLAAFHGGESGDHARIDAARAHEEGEAKPFGYAPHSGYHRLAGKTLQAIVDAAAPARNGWSTAACAHPLAIEVTAGRDRLIVNPGWSPDAAGPQAMRLTAGASTATLGEGSAGQPMAGFLARALGPRLVGAPGRVEARRNENEGGVWLELAHDGWVHSLGLLHERRLFLDPGLDELRGEDRFAPAAEIPAGAARYTPYAVRFHLHPDVQVSETREQSVLLRGPSGRGWWFRNDAQEVTLEPSAWFEKGVPRRSAQIVLRGHASSTAGARVRWKLTPIDPHEAAKR